MTFLECEKVSFPTGKLTFLKCEKRIQKTLLYACEFNDLRPKVPEKDAIRRPFTVLFKRHFAIRAECGFPLGNSCFQSPKNRIRKQGFLRVT